jgi:hypothetical protein
MPLDTAQWKAMVVQGQFPQARLFNFTTYGETGLLTDTIFDANIAPDPGSTNPFATPEAAGAHNYTVTIGASSPGMTNSLNVGEGRLVL